MELHQINATVGVFVPVGVITPSMTPNLLMVIETARDHCLPGKEAVSTVEVMQAVRRMLAVNDRRPVLFQPRRRLARRHQGRHRPSWSTK